MQFNKSRILLYIFQHLKTHSIFIIMCTRENIVTERFNSRFLRDHQVARPIDLNNKVD